MCAWASLDMEQASEGDQAAQSKRHSGFLYHAVVSILIVLVALILRAQHPGKDLAEVGVPVTCLVRSYCEKYDLRHSMMQLKYMLY